MRGRQRVALCCGGAAALLLTGCASPAPAGSASGPDSAGAPLQAGAGPARAAAPLSTSAAAYAGSSTGGTASGGLTALAIGSAGSAIERSVEAAYTVPPGAFLDSFDGVISRAVAMGGFVVSSTTQPDEHGRIISGSAALKVPAARLTELLNTMPATFTVSSINFGSVDHTAAFVDVGARLTSARAHLAALDGLLARAGNLTDITALDEQIATVQAEIDAEQGQLNVLTNSVAYATAAVRLAERGAAAKPGPAPGPIGAGVGGGWSNAVAVTGAVLDYAISALPLLLLAAAVWLGWVLLRPRERRRRLRRGIPSAP